MGVYKRQLKSGLKWRFDGSFKGKHYTSPAIYETQEAAQQAEQKYLLRLRGDTLGALVDARLDYLKIMKVNKDYFNNSRYNLYKAIDFFGYEYPIREIEKREAYEVLQYLAVKWELANCTSHPAKISGCKLLKIQLATRT